MSYFRFFFFSIFHLLVFVQDIDPEINPYFSLLPVRHEQVFKSSFFYLLLGIPAE